MLTKTPLMSMFDMDLDFMSEELFNEYKIVEDAITHSVEMGQSWAFTEHVSDTLRQMFATVGITSENINDSILQGIKFMWDQNFINEKE